jgi:hypothetical protein
MTPILLALALAATPAPGPGPGESLAIVTSLGGSGGVVVTQGKARPVRLFAWLFRGAVLRTEPQGSLTVALWDGRRYALGEGAEVSVGSAGLEVRKGDVQSLPPVSPLPRIGAIRERRGVRSRGGSARIRDGEVTGLYPADGAVALADATVLRFSPVEGAAAYALEVQDETGRVLHGITTPATEVNIPRGVLAAGRSYYWTVRSTGGRVASGGAAFTTLAAPQAEMRAALHAAARSVGDLSALSLAAAVDRELGLREEARLALRALVERAPGDEALRQAAAELERTPSGASPPPLRTP